jgi:hypothetical protein
MEPDFKIWVEVKRKRFTMDIYKIYEGDSLQRFKVQGGHRYIILQSNLPYLLNKKSNKPIEWKLLEGDITEVDPKEAAEALNKIIVAIEYKIKDNACRFL